MEGKKERRMDRKMERRKKDGGKKERWKEKGDSKDDYLVGQRKQTISQEHPTSFHKSVIVVSNVVIAETR